MLVPVVIESSPRGERSFDIYSRLLRERIVFLGSAVDDQVANLVVAQLLHLAAEDDQKDINLYVNSPGGEVYAGMAIYDAMQFVKPDVATVCCGIAMSMGATILAGGAPGKRTSLPNGRILTHQPSGGFRGQVSDVQIHAEEAMRVKELVTETYVRDTGRTREEVTDALDRDRFFTAAEAQEFGLIDRVVEAVRTPALPPGRSGGEPR